MPDQRSVMKEYRYLDEKRLAEGLTPVEHARLEKLRVLVGSEAGAAAPKPGFDVNAAAAALRESLLPAGLRNRPPPTPVQAPPPPAVPEPVEPALDGALASEYAQAPFESLDPAVAPPQDLLFDPTSLGTDPAAYDPNQPQAYDPNQPYDPNQAQAYDPNAYPADASSDPNAQQAWDPNQPYDPNAPAAYDPSQPYDPNQAQAYDPNQPYDPNAAYPADAGADPNAQQAWDPNQPWDPNAAPQDPAAYADAAYDPNAPQAYDPNQPWDPNQPYDPNAAYPADAGADPNAQQAWDPNQPWDPNAAPQDPGAYADAAYGADAAQPQSWDVTALAHPDDAAVASADLADAAAVTAEPAPPDGGSFTQGDLGAAAEGWETQPLAPAPPHDATFGAYDEAGGIEPFAPGTLGAEPPLGSSAFDLDAGTPGELDAPEAAAPAPSDLAAATPGEYDDTAGFAAEPFDASSVPEGTPGLDAGPAAELDAGWQPDQALDAGFELASGGSFAAGADAAAPEWAQSAARPPWDSTPPLDLEAAPAQAAEEVTDYEISPAPASESFGTPAAASDLFAANDGDLAAPEEPAMHESGAAPELDFSQPDFSGGQEGDGLEPHAEPADGSFAAVAAPPAPPADVTAAPPLDLDLAAPPVEPEQPVPAPEELAEGATILDAADVIEEPETSVLETSVPESSEPEPDVAGFAEAAAAAVAAESTDLSAVIEAPPPVVGDALPLDDFSFDVAEEVPVEPEPPSSAKPTFHAAVAIATAGTPVPGELATVSPPAAEPAADFDLSFDLEEPPAPTVLASPPPAAEAPEATPEPAAVVLAPPAPEEVLAPPPPAAFEAFEPLAPASEEEIPTIDGAEILEEIVEDGAEGAPPPPPQSLDFEPLEPEPPVAAPAAVLAPPPPEPVIVAPPPAPPAPPVLAPVLAPPPVISPAPVIAPPPLAPAAAAVATPVVDPRIPGAHRVVVHTVEGLVKRGVLQDPELDAPALALAPQAGTAEEEIPTEKVKAIFFMLAPGEKAPAAEGKRVRVTFRDGRQIAGFSPDYREDGAGFFMIPADTKTNTGRIWVYRAAVRQVAVSA